MTRKSELARTLLAILIAASALSGCGGRSTTPPAPPRAVVLVDVSASDRGAIARSICLSGFRRVVAYVGQAGGSLAVETIDGNPLQDSRTPIDIEFTVPAQFAGNPAYSDPIVSQMEENVIAQMARVMAEAPAAGGTDVLAAIELGARDLARPDTGPSVRFLIVCSDGMNSALPFDFYKLNLTTATTDRTIDQLRAGGRLPVLSGVHVFMVGTGQSTSGQVSAAKSRQLAAFYNTYFRACGAEVDSYSSTLASFP